MGVQVDKDPFVIMLFKLDLEHKDHNLKSGRRKPGSIGRSDKSSSTLSSFISGVITNFLLKYLSITVPSSKNRI